METIYKYQIPMIATIVQMPQNAKILSIGIQNNHIMIWAFVNTANATEDRYFRCYRTASTSQIPDDAIYIGTVVHKNNVVNHVFETSKLEVE